MTKIIIFKQPITGGTAIYAVTDGAAPELLSSVQDIAGKLQTPNAYINIMADIDLAGLSTINLDDNCLLRFSGGKLYNSSSNGQTTIKGKNSSIEAQPYPIFGSNIEIDGYWFVNKSYPEWFEDSDDLIKLNKAAKLLYNNNATTNNKGRGGELILSRIYQISSPFVVPRFTTIVGNNTENAGIKAIGFAPSPTDPTIQSVVFFKNFPKQGKTSYINKSIGCRNFKIICNQQACHGVEMQDPYDCVILENIQVLDISPGYNAFRLYKQYQNVGQTIILMNCLGYKYNEAVYESGNQGLTPEQYLEQLLPSAPVFYMKGIHETSLIGCKAFGGLHGFNDKSLVTDYKVKVRAIATALKRQQLNDYSEEVVANYDEIASYVGNTGFYYEDCRGIVMEGCSSAMVLTAIEIASVGKATVGYTISGQTNEWVFLHDIYTRGNTTVNQYYTVNNITLLPIRRQNSYGSALLKYCSDSTMWLVQNQRCILHYKGRANTFYSTYPLNTEVDVNNYRYNGQGEIIESDIMGHSVSELPTLLNGNSNVLLPFAGAQTDNGFRVAKELFVMGKDDKSHILNNTNYDSISLDVNENKARIKHNKKQRIVLSSENAELYDADGSTKILEANKTSQDNDTGLSIWVKEGTNTRCAQVRLATPASDGTRQLVIDGTALVNPTSGIAAQAPLTGIVVGHCFFFTNLNNKPGWWDGEHYRDASGSIII